MRRYIVAIDKGIMEPTFLMIFRIQDGYMNVLDSNFISTMQEPEKIKRCENIISDWLKKFKITMSDIKIISDIPMSLFEKDIPNKFQL